MAPWLRTETPVHDRSTARGHGRGWRWRQSCAPVPVRSQIVTSCALAATERLAGDDLAGLRQSAPTPIDQARIEAHGAARQQARLCDAVADIAAGGDKRGRAIRSCARHPSPSTVMCMPAADAPPGSAAHGSAVVTTTSAAATASSMLATGRDLDTEAHRHLFGAGASPGGEGAQIVADRSAAPGTAPVQPGLLAGADDCRPARIPRGQPARRHGAWRRRYARW